MFHVPHLFVDVKELGNGTAHDLRAKTDRGCPGTSVVPSVDMFIAGFPCTDVSRLNILKEHSANTIKTSSLRTGSCFRGITEYVHRHKPRWITMENGEGLADKIGHNDGPTNLECCLEILTSLGYWCHVYLLDPTLYGEQAANLVCMRPAGHLRRRDEPV